MNGEWEIRLGQCRYDHCSLSYQHCLTFNQDQLPSGATLLGTVLLLNKTNFSAMTGRHRAHPLLLSLANINKSFWMKPSNHAFLLLALLPIPKFINNKTNIRSVLEYCLFHACLDFILTPLKTAATVGIMMSDPVGNQQYCFTPLASYIVDTPESALIARVGGKTSSVTMASYKQFGNPFWHEP